MDNTTNKTDQTVEVSSNLDAKVSMAEAQRKTAVWVEIFYASMFLLVGLILTIYALVWYWEPNGQSFGYGDLSQNSLFAMGIVGCALIVWGVCSVILAATMQVENKSNHKITNFVGLWNWFTLNPFSWSLIRQSNGYLSKKQKEKLARAAIAAQSSDSVDVKADVTEDQQAEVQQVA